MANSTKRRGFNPIIAFILGILLGMIILVGAVVGAVFFALNYKLDNIEANKENGEYIYINADPDNGGVENALDLISRVIELASDRDSITIGTIENLLPIASTLTERLESTLSQYIDLDVDELKRTRFSELGDFVKNTVLEIRPSALLDNFGGLGDNELVKLLLNGREADYVENGSLKYPVYYDAYTQTDRGFVRADGAVLRASQERFLTNRRGEYILYFYRENNVAYITEKGEEGYAYTSVAEYRYDNFDRTSATLTGNYYYGNDGELVEITPVTIGAFADGSALDVLNELFLTDLVGGKGGTVTDKLLGDLTVGDIVNGEADFDEIVNSLEVSDFVDIDPDNAIMTYLGYGVTGVSFDGGVYRGTYNADGETVECFLEVASDGARNKITGAYYMNGGERVEITATTVNTMSDRINGVTNELALSDLLAIDAPEAERKNAIMIFLAFSVTDIEITENTDGSFAYSGLYHPFDGSEPLPCVLEVSGGKVTGARIADSGAAAEKTTLNTVSTQVNRLTDILKIKDIITVGDDKVLNKLGEYTVGNVKNAVNELTLDDFIEVNAGGENAGASSAVLSYVVYGLTDLTAEAGVGYTHKGVYHSLPDDGGVRQKEECFANVSEEGIITEVFLMRDGEKVNVGTTVNEVSARVAGVTADVTIGQLLNVTDNMLLEAVKNTTIESLSDDIKNLAVNRLYANNVYGSSAGSGDDDAGEALLYLAVDETPLPAASYTEGFVYYVQSGGAFRLAGTTGKLTREEFERESAGSLYTLGEGRILFDRTYLYYEKSGEEDYDLVNGGTGKLSSLDGGEYYTYGGANAMWKLLLYTEAEDETTGETYKTEAAYSINKINQLIINVKNNTQKTTMRELHEAGLMTFENPDDLERVIPGTGECVGDITLENLVNAFMQFIDVTP